MPPMNQAAKPKRWVHTSTVIIAALVAVLLILGMAILTGYPHWMVVVVFLISWRGIQDYVTSPYLMRRGLQLHPLAVIFGVLAGGEIAGVMGLFLSVPIIAGMRIIWKAWRLQPGETEAEILPDLSYLSGTNPRIPTCVPRDE